MTESKFLGQINSPVDLKALDYIQLDKLASEIRELLIDKVTKTGGHLGPNLGVVELTIAAHRIFSAPKDPILFDTGHQSYVHKILTGRKDQFDTLRQSGGLSGYPARSESPTDVIENSHASTVLSWADGIARAMVINGELENRVCAIVGDGALTGGMAWEAINNIAASKDLPIVILVNDNARSYSPTIGGLAQHLSTLRTTKGYETFLKWGKDVLNRTPVVGQQIYETLHGVKKGIKDIVAPQGLFEDLGLKYIGPVDGHNIEAVEKALTQAKELGGPVIVHAITEKGRGYLPALNDEAEKFHAVPISNAATGEPVAQKVESWTDVFSSEIVKIGEKNSKVVCITAAMLGPTGLEKFKANFPDRTFDVGIAEQHAVTSAAGMAYSGLHPVVCVYSTFLNRAFDQLLMDVALHKAGVTFVLDRAGITGDDGPSHNGQWDLAITSIVPGIKIAAPRDGKSLKKLLNEAVEINEGPTIVRFPKGALGKDVPAFENRYGVDILYRGESTDLLVISVGALAANVVEAASIANREDVGVTVVDPGWVVPLPTALITLAKRYQKIAVVEDGITPSSIAANLSQMLQNREVISIGIPDQFLPLAKRSDLLAKYGLDAQGLARKFMAMMSGDSTNLIENQVSLKIEDR